MTATPPCTSCGTKVGDFSGTIHIMKIKRMISENYLMISLCVMMLLVIGYLIYFAIVQIIESVKVYRKAIKTESTLSTSKSGNTQDNEVYDTDNPFNPVDPIRYFEPGKAEFVTNLERNYKEYNTLKSDYILSTYERTNDDVIDKTALYKKYDDYDYKTKTP